MSDGTSIEWTDATWNPLRAWNEGAAIQRGGWACVRVSQGCVNCYAATINKRLGTGLDYTVPALAKVRTYVDDKAITKPSSWRKPRRIFVCSMTDLFGEWVSRLEIARVLNVIGINPRHQFQVLTKRPARMRKELAAYYAFIHQDRPFPNLWVGTSVENQATASDRIAELLATPAAIRFLSCEPLLGPITLPVVAAKGHSGYGRIGWVIVGGESGPRARPMDLAWARSLVAQCKAAGIRVFVKQLGADPVEACPNGSHPGEVHDIDLRDRKGGNPAEWPEDLRVREFPAA